ncbi:hypothetical protein B0H11DRAFT_2148468 [Mycena galericulata]|nr:hypothetical protein B0H11DRAFT_2148468 [Mycena galericulata]
MPNQFCRTLLTALFLVILRLRFVLRSSFRSFRHSTQHSSLNTSAVSSPGRRTSSLDQSSFVRYLPSCFLTPTTSRNKPRCFRISWNLPPSPTILFERRSHPLDSAFVSTQSGEMWADQTAFPPSSFGLSWTSGCLSDFGIWSPRLDPG